MIYQIYKESIVEFARWKALDPFLRRLLLQNWRTLYSDNFIMNTWGIPRSSYYLLLKKLNMNKKNRRNREGNWHLKLQGRSDEAAYSLIQYSKMLEPQRQYKVNIEIHASS